MKKTLLNSIPNEIPHDIQRFVSAANIYDSSCSPEANVYFIDKENGYYLKCSDRGMLEKEAKMTEYFYTKGFGAEVLHYISDDRDCLPNIILNNWKLSGFIDVGNGGVGDRHIDIS